MRLYTIRTEDEELTFDRKHQAISKAQELGISTVDWQDIGHDGKAYAEGGLCADPDCPCPGSWVHWSEISQA